MAKCNEMWRYVAHFFLFFNKMWCHNLILLAPFCATLRHNLTHFFDIYFFMHVIRNTFIYNFCATLRIVAFFGDRWRHNSPCGGRQHHVAPPVATKRHNRPCGVKITNECVPSYMHEKSKYLRVPYNP